MTLRRKKEPGRSDSSLSHSSLSQPMKQLNPSVSTMNRSNFAPEQSARIQAAAAALREQNSPDSQKGKPTAPAANRGTSMFTLQPVVVSEATSAMKWANQYDKHAIRDAYLAGKPAPKLPAAEQQESSTPPPPPLKDSPVLRPSSPRNNRHTMAPSTASTNGCESPLTERRASFDAGPQSPASSIQSKGEGKQKVSRLRAMFGKKEAEAQPTRLAPKTNEIQRKPSFRREHTPVQVTMPAHVEPEPTYVPPAEELKPADPPRQQQEAKHSAFSEGPLDVPAFVPESPRMSPSVPEPPRYEPEPIKDVSELSPPTSANQQINPAPMQDRWAQIKKNAAERAKTAAPPKQPYMPTEEVRPSIDDGETSGEESESCAAIQFIPQLTGI